MGKLLILLPLVLPWYALGRYWVKKIDPKADKSREMWMLAFVLYLIYIASLTVVPDFDSFGFNADNFRINLIPFRNISDYCRLLEWGLYGAVAVNFLGNIVVFMPIGAFIHKLWTSITVKKVALVGLLISLSIELLQIPQPRSTDIDDLWLNVLGVVLGYGVFKATPRNSRRRLARKLTDKFHKNPRE